MSQDRESFTEFGWEESVPVDLIGTAEQVKKKKFPWVQSALLLLTIGTTVVAGFFLHLQFAAQSEEELVARVAHAYSHPSDLLLGIPFSFSILLILLAHEMGHYLACRFYGIQATLPYVIPAPPPIVPFGTFGAVIRIKSMFRDRRQLFDVGIAGPLAGFFLLLPVLAVGLALSNEFTPSDPAAPVLQFGEPLLFRLASEFFYPGKGSEINLHPVGWAAWVGMLATSLNLLPIGQLDGGHIVYAVYGSRVHKFVSYSTFVGLLILSAFSWPMLGYFLFALILLFLRFRHPSPYFDSGLNGRLRHLLLIAALIVFVLTFIPVPVQLIENVGHL